MIRKMIFFGLIMILGWISQVIFDILYNPEAIHQAGIPGGTRTHNITKQGYLQLREIERRDTPPQSIQSSTIKRYNKENKGERSLFAQQGIVSIWIRLDAIQFIGSNANFTKPNSISNRVDKLNDIAPLRSYPYVFAQIIGPTSQRDASNQTGAKITRNNVTKIGKKGMEYTCDAQKLQKIRRLTYSEFIQAVRNQDKFVRSPCQDYRLPHTLAFNYYYYLHKTDLAAFYYMVAALHDNVPEITVSMPAIVRGRAGNNFTSASLRYDRLQNSIQEANAIQQIDKDKSANIEKIIDTASKKAVSEISMYILSTTYPQGLATGEKINKTQVVITIKKILSDCDDQRIACAIIDLGTQQGWIKKNGDLIYPIDTIMQYGRRSDKNQWRLVNKE